MTVQEETTDLQTPSGPMRTYLYWPVASGRYPGPATGELLLGLSLCPANDIIGFLSLRLGTPPTVA